MAKKTIAVEQIRTWANAYNKNTADDRGDAARVARMAVNTLAESALMKCDAYRGFRYLDPVEMVHDGTYDPSARHYH